MFLDLKVETVAVVVALCDEFVIEQDLQRAFYTEGNKLPTALYSYSHLERETHTFSNLHLHFPLFPI